MHSYLYYIRNKNVISDKEFDSQAYQLVDLQKDKEAFKKSDYYECFKGFDGTTGFDLIDRLTELQKDRIIKISYTII